ncbi:hypothetical protein [Acinetobacter baumannii]|uniref:hypothetical protein n=1 Tax=Acinetobacter baumannii TaxID=470 RepID=UPI000452AB46|nr:hypothetical protein [Acinetobacter baumannii]EXA86676.1 hypothetical protein J517_1897 [Acinetobacter baumannii 118362]MDC5445674.1 hypothetical protein [Acinetobacter baumannii]MDV7375781.1 hypothetical protein [Acinetobacter baumannii]
MFVQHKSEYINLNHVVKVKKATSTNNKYAQRDFYKLVLSFTNKENLDLEFNSEEELDQFLEKLEIVK